MTTALNMDAFWMPYSSNKNFKSRPRLIARAKDMHCYDMDGRKMLDTSSGLWCCNAGHCRDAIVKSIQEKAATLDFAPTFQLGHPDVFTFSERLTQYSPDPLNAIFLTNSGSEAADTAIKIALAYHKIRGKGGKQLMIGRERGYHGVGFGGISVGGLVKNRSWFGNQMLRCDHLPHTYKTENNFSRGIPEHGGEECANGLLDLINLHDASTIAAVMVEPVAGSTGVLPPPKGYLQRLRQICDEHDILLIFDEVITAFGRLGKKTASEYFGVTPDLLTFAKGATSGSAPLGGVMVRDDIRQTFLDASSSLDIDFFHGYTYSGHPLSVAAGMGTLDVYEEEGLMERIETEKLTEYFADGLHAMRGLPNVKDIRNIGFMGAVELEGIPGSPGKRAFDIFEHCFHEQDMLLRVTGDTIAFSPPLIAEKIHLDEMFGKVMDAIRKYQ
ncbi:MAG: aspartate aminotransferase family protein [Gammaproteobacteria bacterium WSBS_2016_MAG_OTU1]